MVRHIMMHDEERTQNKLSQLTTHGDTIDALYTNISDYHKEDVAL